MNIIRTKSMLLALITLAACAQRAIPPMEVGDSLVLSSDHPFIVPPEGIRFSNGATIGVAYP